MLRSCTGDTGVALGTLVWLWSGPGVMVLAQESGTGSLERLWALLLILHGEGSAGPPVW